MPNRARDKQLAKLAARRQVERKAAKRRRDLTLGVAGGIAGLVLLVAGYMILTGGDDGENQASASPTVTDRCDHTAPPGAGGAPPTFDAPPPEELQRDTEYSATIETSCGTIEVELLRRIAPAGVNNFVFLANEGFYDGLTFHRIEPGFVVQGGDPAGDGSGGPGYGFEIETSPDQTFDEPGLLAYANSGPDSNGSQFFITLDAAPHLDPGGTAGEFTIFGRVTKGLGVVRQLGAQETEPGPGCPGGGSCLPVKRVYIDAVTIEERPK